MNVKKGRTTDWDKLKKHFQQLDGLEVDAGYFAESGYHSDAGIPYATLMYRHEFGLFDDAEGALKNTPPRPLMTLTAEASIKPSIMRGNLGRLAKDTCGQIGKLSSNANKLGKEMQKLGQSMFGDSMLADNAPLTQKLKGRNDPLVDTGELRQNFGYKTSLDDTVKK